MHCLSRYKKLGKFREKILPQPPISNYAKPKVNLADIFQKLTLILGYLKDSNAAAHSVDTGIS